MLSQLDCSGYIHSSAPCLPLDCSFGLILVHLFSLFLAAPRSGAPCLAAGWLVGPDRRASVGTGSAAGWAIPNIFAAFGPRDGESSDMDVVTGCEQVEWCVQCLSRGSPAAQQRRHSSSPRPPDKPMPWFRQATTLSTADQRNYTPRCVYLVGAGPVDGRGIACGRRCSCFHDDHRVVTVNHVSRSTSRLLTPACCRRSD
jgi:hypothetical protein